MTVTTSKLTLNRITIIMEALFSYLFISVYLISCGQEAEKKKETAAADAPTLQIEVSSAKAWKVIGNQGSTRFVFVDPLKARDGVLLAQILQTMIGNKTRLTKPVEVLFFDKESETPTAFPMTDAQMLHQVAQYNYNPNNGFEEFLWVSVSNPNSSPPGLKTRKANIGPGIAP